MPDCTANTNNYFVRSGLYFPSYDATALVSTLQRAMAAGEAQVSVRFADDAYVTACASLVGWRGNFPTSFSRLPRGLA